MKQSLIIICLLMHLFCSAQHTNKYNKIQFQSLNQICFIRGKVNTEPLFQSINGIRYRSLFVGAGVGLDYYKERSIPIFIDIRKNLLNKVNTPFIYIDGGYNAIWQKEKPEDWISKGYKGGLYYDAGIGYTFLVSRSNSLVVSLGYSSKEMTEERNKYVWISIWPQPNSYETLEYKLQRYSFKMGLAF